MRNRKSICHLSALKILKPVITFVLLFWGLANIFATSLTVSGNVSGTWNTDTVFVAGDLVIPINETLSILPGTIITFNGYFRLDVHGQVLATGMAGDSIVFTVSDTSNFGAQTTGRGGWSGIQFVTSDAASDSSLFSFCSFKFGKATGDSANCYGGAIRVKDFSKVRMNNCLFYHNYSYFSGGAIYLWNADIRIEHCVFSLNYAGNTGIIYGYGGGLCSMWSSPVVKGNEFLSNTSTGVGGGVSFDQSGPVFNNNIFMYNLSGLGGAFGILRSTPAGTIANNLVVHNEARFFGGGICCIRSFPVFSNLTVSGNHSAYGGGFYCNDSAVPSMYNSIIWGNSGLGESVYIWDIRSAPNFYYCDIEGDTTDFEGSGGQEGYHGSYKNNISSEPVFSASASKPYSLAFVSPCIDSGIPDPVFLNLPLSDIGGVSRIVNGRIDIGAYEYSENVDMPEINKNGPFMLISPNPFCLGTEIVLHQEISDAAIIYIYDIRGQCVRHLNLVQEDDSAFWDGRNDNGYNLPSGIYFLKILKAGMVLYGKAVKQNN